MEFAFIVVRLILVAILFIVAAAFSVKLSNGSWLSLIAQPEQNKKGTFYPAGTTECGKRVAWLMVACTAAVAALGFFLMSKLAGSPGMATVSTIVCNISLIAFCAGSIVIIARRSKAEGALFQLGGPNLRLSLFLAAWCVVLTIVSLLYV